MKSRLITLKRKKEKGLVDLKEMRKQQKVLPVESLRDISYLVVQ